MDCDLEGPRQFIFEENESLRAKTTDERIGRVFTTFQISETKANQSTAEGKWIIKAIVGIEASFVLTTRNAVGQQCYEKRAQVTVEIKS